MKKILIALLMIALSSCAKEGPSKDVDIDALDSSFRPAALSVEPGEKVTFKVHNRGKMKHNISFEEADIDEDLEPGKTVEVTFDASDSLTHQQLYCKYHRESDGMVINLNIPRIDKPGGGKPGNG